MKNKAQPLGFIGLMGGLGGAVNAWLCYAKIPVSPGYTEFAWHMIPAGAVHGGVLAVVAVGAALLVWDQKPAVQWGALPVVGWLAGWWSWAPLQQSIFGKGVIGSLFWPFHSSLREMWLGLLQYFGLVSLLYYGGLVLGRQLRAADLRTHQVIAGASGVLGSLWFWIDAKPWYLCFLHGAIWGSLVGFGVWKSRQTLTGRGAPS